MNQKQTLLSFFFVSCAPVRLRKKFFSVFVLLVSIPFLSYAQSEDIFRHPLTAQTTPAFRTVCARLAQNPYIRGSFEQEKTLNRLNRSLKSSGNFLIIANLGMVWDTVRPFPSTLVLGKDFIIQSRPGGQRTVLNAQGNETFLGMADIISSVFSGNAQGLENNFNIFFTGSPSSWEMGLIPLDSAITSFAQRIIMTGANAIRTIHITEQNGDSILYVLSNHSFPGTLDANENALFTLP